MSGAPITKSGDLISEAYRRWVRSLPCAAPDCAAPPPSQVQHAPTRGANGCTNDLQSHPTCHACHRRCEGLSVNVDGLILSPISVEERLDYVRETLLLFFARAPWNVMQEVLVDVRVWRESRVYVEVPF